MEQQQRKNHCLILPYPLQGHINPMLQFSKRLKQQTGTKITLVSTVSVWKTISTTNLTSIEFETESISDGYDDGGQASATTTENTCYHASVTAVFGGTAVTDQLQRFRVQPW